MFFVFRIPDENDSDTHWDTDASALGPRACARLYLYTRRRAGSGRVGRRRRRTRQHCQCRPFKAARRSPLLGVSRVCVCVCVTTRDETATHEHVRFANERIFILFVFFNSFFSAENKKHKKRPTGGENTRFLYSSRREALVVADTPAGRRKKETVERKRPVRERPVRGGASCGTGAQYATSATAVCTQMVAPATTLADNTYRFNSAEAARPGDGRPARVRCFPAARPTALRHSRRSRGASLHNARATGRAIIHTRARCTRVSQS